MDEDFVPISSQFLPTEPVEQKNERAKQKAEVFSALPLLKAVIERFDDRIEFYSSVDSIPVELHAVPEQFMHAVAAAKATKDYLLAERDYLEELIEDTK